MRGGARIANVEVTPFDAPMSEPFEISGGGVASARNVLVRLRLADGTNGYGEGAPLPAFNGETQEGVLASARAVGADLVGRDVMAWRSLLREIEDRLPACGAARGALSTSVLDAFTRRVGIPLRALFGGAEAVVRSDVTVAIVSPAAARSAARRIVALGVDTIKVKVGTGIDEDEARVVAVARAAPRATLLLDANQGATARGSIRLLRRLRARGVEPLLFEQPAPRGDWQGLADVHRLGRIAVAADESVTSRADATEAVRRRAVQVINVKLMKSGMLEAWDIATIARAGGIEPMIGALVETSLACAASAHLAAGLGGFRFVDLDTPLWLSRDPMRGVRFARGGVYDLRRVRAGVGVVPRGA